MNASILTIGTEILIGQTIDTNSAWIGSHLESLGIQIKEIRSIADKHEDIIKGLEDLSKQSELVLVTGGLGPTEDDITKKAIAAFLDVPLYFDKELYQRIQDIFTRIGVEIRESHRNQCNLPEGVEKLQNNLGTAPGMWFRKGDRVIISMPGVPFEMKNIMEYQVLPKLKERMPLSAIYHKTIMTAGVAESDIENRVKPVVESLPKNYNVAYLPSLRKVRIRISGIGKDVDQVKTVVESATQKMINILGSDVYGFDDITLSKAIQNLAIEKNMTIATAESCTGGNIAQSLTAEAGASGFFVGSVVAYANEIKKKILSVKEKTLQEQGAVSEKVVIEMVEGLLTLTGADIGVAVSGVAGPSGGTPDKPVGTIWLAWGNQDKIMSRKLNLSKDRSQNIKYSTVFALNELRKFLIYS